jgi:hypothetical protein
MAVPAIAARGSLIQFQTAFAAASAGTIASTGTAVTGTTTAFEADLVVGDQIAIVRGGREERRLVVTRTSDTALVIDRAFTPDVTAGTAFWIVKYSPLLYCGGITGPGASADVIDVTDLSVKFKSFVAGNIDPGDFSFEVWYQPKVTSHAALRNSLLDGGIRRVLSWMADSAAGFTVSPPPHVSNSRVDFRGFVTGFNQSAQVGDAHKADCTIKITDEPIQIVGVDT